MVDILNFIRESRRVMNVATRPRRKDFEKIVKITALGMVAIGVIGVLIAFVLNLI